MQLQTNMAQDKMDKISTDSEASTLPCELCPNYYSFSFPIVKELPVPVDRRSAASDQSGSFADCR